MLRLGLPKGSLQEPTFRILNKAGFNVSVSERSYFPRMDDEEIDPVLLRAQEMSRYVEDGALDAGITGNDWVLENGSDVVRVAELRYSKQSLNKVRWVLAVPEGSGITSPKQLAGKRVASEVVAVATQYFQRNGVVDVDVEFSWGATEVKVSAGLVDAIIELTETGRSLRANKLTIIDTVCESTTQLIANKTAYADPWKREKMEQLVMLLQGAIAAESKVGLKMNCRQVQLPEVLSTLPSLKNPTVSPLSEEGWCAVETILDEQEVRALIPKLKAAGAEGIIEYPLNKLIY